MWKDVRGYEGYYIVSDTGEVRGVDRAIVRNDDVVLHRRARKIQPRQNKDGYLTVKLNRDGASRVMFVHRLVAAAFIRDPQEGEEVNHIDCNRANNCVSNLEWVSHVENIRYSKSIGSHISCTDRSGQNNPNYGNRTLSKKYKDRPDLREAQSRPGARNGRARKIGVTIDSDILWFDYIGACAQYLFDKGYIQCRPECAATPIRKAAEGGKLYKGLQFTFTN